MTDRVSNILGIVSDFDESEKFELIRQLLGDESMLEDILDLMAIISQQDETAEDYDTFIMQLRKEGRPV